MGNEFKDKNIFIEVTVKGTNLKKLVRADLIKNIEFIDGSVFIYDERDIRSGLVKGFPVNEGYETVIELCIRAGKE